MALRSLVILEEVDRINKFDKIGVFGISHRECPSLEPARLLLVDVLITGLYLREFLIDCFANGGETLGLGGRWIFSAARTMLVEVHN